MSTPGAPMGEGAVMKRSLGKESGGVCPPGALLLKACDRDSYQASGNPRDGQIHDIDRRRRAARDRQCRHRHDHPQAISEDDQAHRPRRRPVLGDALQRRRLAQSRLRAQQARLRQGQDSRRRRQFRLRLVARARALGAARFRHPLRHLDRLRRHFLQQLLQERHSAGQGVAGRSGEADGRRAARRQRDADRRSAGAGNPRPRRRRRQVRDRRRSASIA